MTEWSEYSPGPSRTQGRLRIFGVTVLRGLGKRQFRTGILLYVAYLAATRVSSALFVAPAVIFPAAGIAIGALFLETVYLWPFVYAASLTSYLLGDAPLAVALIMPAAHTLHAVAGALLLKRLKVDPILRRGRDIFSIILIALSTAVIVPTASAGAYFLADLLSDANVAAATTWTSWWTGLVLSTLILTPFVLRWFAKPHFSRTLPQAVETALALGAVMLLSYLAFWTRMGEVGGLPLEYLLLVPLFWIALRLGPRFLTLALVLLAAIALSGTYLGAGAPAPGDLGARLLEVQVMIDVIAVIFFIIVTIEEERRMATKLLTSQIGTLRSTLDQLAEKDKAKNDFIAVLAHELRNPLASVMSSVGILEHELPPKPEAGKALRIIDERMRTVRRLLEDLMDVTRISERKLAVEKELIDLRILARRAASACEHQLAERGQRLAVSLPEEPVGAHADPVRIEQIVTNLLTNASKYSGEGTAITLALRADGGTAVISVKDEGIGIDPMLIPSIFEPFRQIGQGEATKQGLGIGLALVKSLVEMHGGRIEARSEGAGKGSEFVVFLPATKEAPQAAEAPAEAPQAAKEGPRTVLVVDDNDAAAWSVGKLLELKGYGVIYAYDGAHAIERCLADAPDVVLLDIGLPDGDGFGVAKAMRTMGFSGKLVALTGFSDDEDRRKAAEAGFDHHLVKPVGIAELRRVLRS